MSLSCEDRHPRSVLGGYRVELGLGGVDELVPGNLEFLDAFGFEHLEHVVKVDSGARQLMEHRVRAVIGSGNGVAGDHAVVGHRLKVFSGMVFTVCGATRSTTYRVSS